LGGKGAVLGGGEKYLLLNLGCGLDIRPGINCDIKLLPGVDVVCDLEASLPFRTGTFEQVLALDVLEHLADVVRVLNEVWRASRPGASLVVRGPYWGPQVAADVTHLRGFVEGSFDHFDPTTPMGQKYGYYTPFKWRVIGEHREGSNIVFELEKR